MKNVLLTGASRGIGRQIKELLEKEGYIIYGTSSAEFDLSVCENAKLLYDRAKEAMGSVDILINNAGSYICKPVDEMTLDETKRLIELNFTVPYLLCSYSVSDMKKNKWGRIINIGSISGAVGEAYASLYSAAKAALSGATKSLALELAQYNITVNQINPGWVDTDLTQNALDEDEKRETLDVIPQRRFIEPIEIANLCKYILSDQARGLSGQCINLCAGLSCGC